MPYEFIESQVGAQLDIGHPFSQETEQLRADIIIYDHKLMRLWGQIISSAGHPIPYALVQLVTIHTLDSNVSYHPIAHTTSDADGFYRFDIYGDDSLSYKILVSKPNQCNAPPSEFCLEDISSPEQTLPVENDMSSTGYRMSQNKLYAKTSNRER